VQRALPDRVDSSYARVRGRRLLAREHGAPLREGAGRGLQAEEGRDRPGGGADPRTRHALPRRVRRARRRTGPGRAGCDRERCMSDFSFYPLVFYLLAAITVGSAVGVAFSNNIVYSAFALMGTLLGAAGLFVLLAADFVAVIQVLIYVGGILVLMLFAVML